MEPDPTFADLRALLGELAEPMPDPPNLAALGAADRAEVERRLSIVQAFCCAAFRYERAVERRECPKNRHGAVTAPLTPDRRRQVWEGYARAWVGSWNASQRPSRRVTARTLWRWLLSIGRAGVAGLIPKRTRAGIARS